MLESENQAYFWLSGLIVHVLGSFPDADVLYMLYTVLHVHVHVRGILPY